MSARRSSSTVSKRRTHSRFSFRVRMNRSAQPLPSGSRTNAGELSMPRKRISAWRSWLTYWLPWSWRSCRPAATSLANAPQRSRTACLTGSSASSGRRAGWHGRRRTRPSAGRPPGGARPPPPAPARAPRGVGAPAGRAAAAPGGGVVAGDDPRGPPPAGHHRGRVGPPHQVDPVRGDRAVVGPRAVPTPGTPVRQQAVLTREPQDAAPAGADPREAQPRAQLAIALTVEGAVLRQLPDLPEQGRVRHRADRPRPPPRSGRRWR